MCLYGHIYTYYTHAYVVMDECMYVNIGHRMNKASLIYKGSTTLVCLGRKTFHYSISVMSMMMS